MKPLNDNPRARAHRARRKAARKGYRLVMDGQVWRLVTNVSGQPVMVASPSAVEHFLVHGARQLTDQS